MRQVSWRESLREASMTRDRLTQTEGDALITVVLHRFVRPIPICRSGLRFAANERCSALSGLLSTTGMFG